MRGRKSRTATMVAEPWNLSCHADGPDEPTQVDPGLCASFIFVGNPQGGFGLIPVIPEYWGSNQV